jgi:hypothetical protein
MKTRTFTGMMVMLTALVGMTACSIDDNPANQISAVVQTYYYYYMDQKIPLTLNENNFCINIPKEHDEIRERVQGNVHILDSLRDKVFNSYIVTRTDYQRLTSQDFWKEDAKSVIVTASFFDENNKVVVLSPYISVKLKKEEDIDLLTSYAEKYRLINDLNSIYFPLFYTLHVTPESEKSPLQIANELRESGDFEYSQPDLVSCPFINTSGDIAGREVLPEEIPEGALNQTTTEFGSRSEMIDGYTKTIDFGDMPVEERPKTVAEFVNRFIGEGLGDCFRCTQQVGDGYPESGYYQQYYKDVIVKIYPSRFDFKDGTMIRATCRYMPIKDFDVTPKFDKWVAYEIFKSFMKLENYYEDRCELQIACVPEGDSYVPRLAYEVKKGYVGLVIDACSGRALYRTSYDW